MRDLEFEIYVCYICTLGNKNVSKTIFAELSHRRQCESLVLNRNMLRVNRNLATNK